MQAGHSPFRRASEALAYIFQLLQAANTAYGSDFITMYDLFKLVKMKLSQEVQFEIDGVIALDNKIDLRRLEWAQIEDLVTDAWGTASRRPKSFYARLNIAPNAPKDQQQLSPRHHSLHLSRCSCRHTFVRRQDPQVPAVHRRWIHMQ